ncbi:MULTISPECIES: helix-turn-helix domain-containing protein [unclassified Micromonospora]|uniref:helix-turn-helix domain-containing protein n=1 Tax=unclassified Micromonospora TaxID=2617518 RepID=UPI003634954A
MPRWKWFQRKDEPVDVVERGEFNHHGERLRRCSSDVFVGSPHDAAGSRPHPADAKRRGVSRSGGQQQGRHQHTCRIGSGSVEVSGGGGVVRVVVFEQVPTTTRSSAELVTPEEVADARRLAGDGLAAVRRAAGVTQVRLARMVSWSRSTVANVEIARQTAPMEYWAACDAALDGEGALLAGWERLEVLSRRLREQKAVELFRQRLARRQLSCACGDHLRSLAGPGASLSLERMSAALAGADGSDRG